MLSLVWFFGSAFLIVCGFGYLTFYSRWSGYDQKRSNRRGGF